MRSAQASFSPLDRAVQAERQGRTDEARALALSALAEASDPALLNSLGSLLMRVGDPASAVGAFARASMARPADPEPALNHAIALSTVGRAHNALDVLEPLEQRAGGQARYWSIRANAARQAGLLAEARRCYERALRCDPAYAKARQGLAQIALERGEPDAAALYRDLIAAGMNSPWLWRGLAEALAAEGRNGESLALARQIARQLPQWPDGLHLLAQARLAAGEPEYLDHYAEAVARFPDDPAIPQAWIALLAGLDHYAEASDVAATAAARFPQTPQFRMLEAVHAGNAGDDARAEAIFAELPLHSAERRLHEARHRLRLADFTQAGWLLGTVLAEEPWNVTAWALRDLVWRATGDGAHAWLHGRDGLVQHLPLEAADGLLTEATEALRTIHARSALPLDQSLRGGTQTRGSLFGRHEPVFERLRDAIEQAVERYRAALPPHDAAHPLLRHRDTPWRFAGSWSVRLTGGGDHHTAHIHPQGIVSSALYLIVPEREAGEAQLELGRPPPDLRLDLPPLHVIDPAPGTLVLFPSTLYHGTTPFSRAERMTVAFDLAARDDFP